MELMFYLSVLPLTRQLTNLSGNLWGKTLQVSPCSIYLLPEFGIVYNVAVRGRHLLFSISGCPGTEGGVSSVA